MLELVVLCLRAAAFGGGGVAAHGLWLLAAITLLRYLAGARKRANRS